MMDVNSRSSVDSSNGSLSKGSAIVIGLVNNMPDAALESTERQFRNLLVEASPNRSIHLKLFSFSRLERSKPIREYIDLHYQNIDTLWAEHLDGMIVTGAEPRAARLSDEPYWTTFTKLVDWADESATTAIWSCLAAHAAVLHRDGIERRRFATKLSGVFECAKVADHSIVRGAQSRWCVPHSRHYDLSERDLIARNYTIVARSSVVGADIFVKQGKALSVFVQGHPEYDCDTLLREYRRDIRRFIAGEREDYPEIPRGYLDEEIENRFRELHDRILVSRSKNPVMSFPTVTGGLEFSWRGHAVSLYSNWLSHVGEQKQSGDRSKSTAAITQAVLSPGSPLQV